MNYWGLSIASDPMQIEGFKMDAGNILLNKIEFNLEAAGNELDKKIQQQPMYTQADIGNWSVVYHQKDESCLMF